MTTWEAEQRESALLANEKSSTQYLWINLLLRPIAAFGLRYIKEGGWKDGYRGLIISLLWSMYVSLTYIKIWEHDLHLPENWWQEDWKHQVRETIK